MNKVEFLKGNFPSFYNPWQFETAVDIGELKTEVVRKAFHFLIALSPGMAAVNRPLTVAVLIVGVLFYACMERLRLSGTAIPL
ncbi:MAG: hypothetical protein LBH57_09060, partial [Treponema sp.]|nr:hypothetical protein [Treponema sp.]